MRFVARFWLALTVSLVCLSSFSLVPASAASYGWVYVVVRDSVCGSPQAKVKDVQGNFNWVRGSSTINFEGDGDNIVYPRVQLKTRVDYQINAACFVGKRRAGFRVITGSFKADRHKQTIWVG